MARSVINCRPDKEFICEAIRKVYKINIDNNKHPYGEGNSSELMIKVIKSIDSISLKKSFYDIKQH